ncbi:MAG: hypothetical protein ACLUHG_01715, partial [Sutterella wadsworthensis]
MQSQVVGEPPSLSELDGPQARVRCDRRHPPQAALTVIDGTTAGIASSFFGTSFSTYDVENVSMEARRLGRTKCNDGAEWEILYDRVLKAGREFRLDAQRIGLAEGERLDVDEIEGFGELYPGFERLRAAFAAMGEAMRAN